MYYNILAGSLLFLLLISHYLWFPLELHSPFEYNGNNLTCACKLKVTKPKQWDPVVNEGLYAGQHESKDKFSYAHHGWKPLFRMTFPELEETAGDSSLTLYTGMTRFPRSAYTAAGSFQILTYYSPYWKTHSLPGSRFQRSPRTALRDFSQLFLKLTVNKWPC